MYFDRWDIAAAYNMFDILWGPTPYNARLHKIGFRPGGLDRLAALSENAKAIYGQLVLRHHRLYVAYGRYAKRNRLAPVWPGTNNMRGNDPHLWLSDIGLLPGVSAYA